MRTLMTNAAWLVAPYLSMLGITRWQPLGRRVAGHTAITLPIGWAGVVVLFGALLELWSLPVPAMIAAGAASGLAMILSRGGGEDGDDWPDRPDDDPPPLSDRDRFDRSPRPSGRFTRTGPVRTPSGAL
jgi:hypothetical protein